MKSCNACLCPQSRKHQLQRVVVQELALYREKEIIPIGVKGLGPEVVNIALEVLLRFSPLFGAGFAY